MDRADKAMYGAQAAGRNWLLVWDPIGPRERQAADTP